MDTLPIEALVHLRLYLELGQIVNLSACNKRLHRYLSLPQAVEVIFIHSYLETKAQIYFSKCTLPPPAFGTRCWSEILPLSALSHNWILTTVRPKATNLIVTSFDCSGGYKYVAKAAQDLRGEQIPREILFSLWVEKRMKGNRAKRALQF